MTEYMAKRRQLKRSECNEEPPTTKVSIHYKKQNENNTTVQRKLNKKIYVVPTGMEEAPKAALDIHCLRRL